MPFRGKQSPLGDPLPLPALDRIACDRVRRFPLAHARMVLLRTLLQGLPACAHSRHMRYPDLSDMQKKVIALDYDMRDGKAAITVRKALPHHTLKRLELDTDPTPRQVLRPRPDPAGGLGKTIEAGIVLCQHWAKRRRRTNAREQIEHYV